MCSFCGKLDKNFLCKECKSKVEKLEQIHIDKYYNKKYHNIENLKKHNLKKYKYYDEHIYLFKYEGYIREKILQYKFNGKSYYCKTFVEILLNNKKMCEILKSYDIIIPVPIHNKKRKERGYNQTELIAEELSKQIKQMGKNKLNGHENAICNLNLEIEYKNILQKVINTKPQSTLNKKQRIENSKNAYEIKKGCYSKLYEEISYKNVLIFDDIYTTGSTSNECAKIIRKLNPKKIGILTIAKD